MDEMSAKENIDPSKTSISEDEAALYDRQIRLWGLDAQKRQLRNTFSLSRIKIAVIVFRNFNLKYGKVKMICINVKSEKNLKYFISQDSLVSTR